MIKNKKGQNSQMLMIVGAILLLVVSGFAFNMGGGGDDSRDDVSQVPDNEKENDKEIDPYTDREEKRVYQGISELEQDKVILEVTCDDSVKVCDLKDIATNETINVSSSKLDDVIGELPSEYEVEKIAYNKLFNVDNFDKYYQAVLVKRDNWNDYQLIWSLNDEDFIMTELKKISGEDFNSDTGLGSLDDIMLAHYNSNIENIYAKYIGDTDEIENIVSLVIELENGNILIMKDYTYATASSGCYTYHNKHTLSLINSDIGIETKVKSFGTTGCGASPRYSGQFSVADYVSYSYDRIAVNNPTRSVGFDKLSISKQERTDVYNMDKTQSKILSKANFDYVLENGVGTRVFTNFANANLNDIMSSFKDSPIALWSDTINFNNYGLGDAGSEDFDYSDGFVLDGKFTNTNNVSFLETGTYVFQSQGSQGLVMDDTGSVKLVGEQIMGENYGLMSFEDSNSEITFQGTAYVVNNVVENGQVIRLWDRVSTGILNLFDYSFDYSQWLTEEVTNGKFTAGDDYNSCALTGCKYPYVTSMSDDSSSQITLVTEKPFSPILNYGGKSYWSFWRLDSMTNDKGCVIIDSPTSELGRMPVSICKDSITGANSFAQFKMIGLAEE